MASRWKARSAEIREELGRESNVVGKHGEAIQFFFASDEDRWYRMEAHFYAAQLKEEQGGGEFDLHWVDARREASRFFHECHVWAANCVPAR